MRVLPRKQAGPGWAAAGIVVKMAHAQTFVRQAVEVGGIYFAAVTAEVAVPHIVGHYNNYVGSVCVLILCKQTTAATPKNDQ